MVSTMDITCHKCGSEMKHSHMRIDASELVVLKCKCGFWMDAAEAYKKGFTDGVGKMNKRINCEYFEHIPRGIVKAWCKYDKKDDEAQRCCCDSVPCPLEDKDGKESD